MHTRRFATFLLGAWLGGSLLIILIQTANLRFTTTLLSTPSDQAASFMRKTALAENYAMVLKYQAAEQNRRYSDVWEQVQLGVGLILAATLFMGTQRRIFPLILCFLMLLLVLFEHFGVSPELAYRGRVADFPAPGNPTDALLRLYAVGQSYAWVEGMKLAVGVLLSGYLFIFRPRRMRRSTDLPDHSHQSSIARALDP